MGRLSYVLEHINPSEKSLDITHAVGNKCNEPLILKGMHFPHGDCSTAMFVFLVCFPSLCLVGVLGVQGYLAL